MAESRKSDAEASVRNTEKMLADAKTDLSSVKEKISGIKGQISSLEKVISEISDTDEEKLNADRVRLEARQAELSETADRITGRTVPNRRLLENITEQAENLRDTEKKWKWINSLNNTVLGKIAEGVVLNQWTDCYMQLQNGDVQGVVVDKPVGEAYLNKNADKAKFAGDKFGDHEEYAFAVKKGNTELLDKLNAGLANLKESGKYDELVAKWFN